MLKAGICMFTLVGAAVLCGVSIMKENWSAVAYTGFVALLLAAILLLVGKWPEQEI